MDKKSINGKKAQLLVYNHIKHYYPDLEVIMNHINSNKTDILLDYYGNRLRIEVKSCQVKVGVKHIRLGRFFITPKEIFTNDIFVFVYNKNTYFINSEVLKVFYWNKNENITRYCISIIQITKFLFFKNIIDYINKYEKN